MESTEFLAHYGVLGQKWGVRRERSNSSSGTRKSSLSTKQKVVIGSAIVIGVAVTGAILVKSGKLDVSAAKTTIARGKAIVDKARSPQAKAAVTIATAASKAIGSHEPSDSGNEKRNPAEYRTPTVVSIPPARSQKGPYNPPLISDRHDAEVRESARKYWTSPAGKTMAKNLNMDMAELQKKLDDPDYVWNL